MFEKLFEYPRVLARHRDGPLSDARESYLSHRADEGTAPNTLLRVARALLLIVTEINLMVGQDIGNEGQSSCTLRGSRCKKTHATVARGPKPDGIHAIALAA